MEIHHFCKECLKNHPKWKLIKDKVWLINDAGQKTIQICNLIKEDIGMSDVTKKQFSDEELGMIGLLYDPLMWANLEFKWQARWYQETMLKCSAYRKVNRIGRRAGKTETLCIKMVHYAYTTENTTSLVIAPYKNQVGLIFDRLDVLLSDSPSVRGSIKRNTKNPYRIQFHNGSKILGFTSGTRTGSKT